MRDIDTEMVLRLVAENAKQRFELAWAYDPSPPKPKAKKGQGKGKGKGKPKPVQQASVEGAKAAEDGEVGKPKAEGTSEALATEKTSEVDAAKVDVLAKDLEATQIRTELPLVMLPRPDVGSEESSNEASTTDTQAQPGEWFIRATQGHSIKLDSVSHLTPVTDDEEGRARAGVCVHGTKWELWDALSKWCSSSLP